MKPGLKKALGWIAGLALTGGAIWFFMKNRKVDVSRIQWATESGELIDPARWQVRQLTDGSIGLFDAAGVQQNYVIGRLDNKGIYWTYPAGDGTNQYWLPVAA